MQILLRYWIFVSYMITVSAISFSRGFYTKLGLPTEINITDSYSFFTERLLQNTIFFSSDPEKNGIPMYTFWGVGTITGTVILLAYVTPLFSQWKAPQPPQCLLCIKKKFKSLWTKQVIPKMTKASRFLDNKMRWIVLLFTSLVLFDLQCSSTLTYLIVVVALVIMFPILKKAKDEHAKQVLRIFLIFIWIFVSPVLFYAFGSLHAKEMVNKNFGSFPPACLLKENETTTTLCGQLLMYSESKSCIWRNDEEFVDCRAQGNYRTIVRDTFNF